MPASQRLRSPAGKQQHQRRKTAGGQAAVRDVTICVALCYAAVLAARGGSFNIVLSILVLADVAAGLTLWRIGGAHQSVRARLMENLGYLVIFSGVILLTVSIMPSWVRQSGAWPWYLIALAAGCGLIGIGGISPQALWSGELALMAGKKPKINASVNIMNMIVGAAAEEVMFRSVTLQLAGIQLMIISVLASATFLGRHHLARWAVRRANPRTYVVEISGTFTFLILTVLSRSIFPALIAHLVNNTPS